MSDTKHVGVYRLHISNVLSVAFSNVVSKQFLRYDLDQTEDEREPRMRKYLFFLALIAMTACTVSPPTQITEFVDLSKREKPEAVVQKGWTEVVIGAPDIEELSKFWTEIGGFEIRNRTSKSLLLGAPGVSDWGLIRLVEAEGQLIRPFGSQAWDTGCYYSVMHRAKNLRSVVEDAKKLGWEPLTADVVFLEFGPSQLHVIVLGHPETGVQVQLYERLTTPLPESFPDFDRVSAPFNIMQMVRDRDQAYDFFQQGLGFATFYYGKPYLSEKEEIIPINIPKELTDEIAYSAAITFPMDDMEWGRMEMIAIAKDKRLAGSDFSNQCRNPVGIKEVVFGSSSTESLREKGRHLKLVEDETDASVMTQTPDGAILRFYP